MPALAIRLKRAHARTIASASVAGATCAWLPCRAREECSARGSFAQLRRRAVACRPQCLPLVYGTVLCPSCIVTVLATTATTAWLHMYRGIAAVRIQSV